jgi:hypothetical protein
VKGIDWRDKIREARRIRNKYHGHSTGKASSESNSDSELSVLASCLFSAASKASANKAEVSRHCRVARKKVH